MSTKFSVGEIPLDSAQTIRKAWVDERDAHRVIPLNPLYNRTLPEYNSNGTLDCISYYYDKIAEVTEITFNADVAGSLDGTEFDLYSGRDLTLYKLFYVVDGGATVPADTATTKYITVNLTSNDFKEVVTLATKIAIENHVTASEDFSVFSKVDKLEITTLIKGDTTDASDVSTGFTSQVLTQGLTELVDKLCFFYDSNGQLIKIETESGDNITGWDVIDIRNIVAARDNIAIKDPESGNTLKIGSDGQIYVDILSTSSDVISVNPFNEISAVATNVETTITTHTAAVGKTSRLQRIVFSGSNIAEYKVKVNGNTIDKKRTYFSGGLDGEFNFMGNDIPGLELSEGDVVTITVKHKRPVVGDFDSRIQVMEIG